MESTIFSVSKFISIIFGLIVISICVSLRQVLFLERFVTFYSNDKKAFNFEHIFAEKRYQLNNIENDINAISALMKAHRTSHHINSFPVDEGPRNFFRIRTLVYRGNHDGGFGDRIRGVLKGYFTAMLTERFFCVDENVFNSFSSVFENRNGFQFLCNIDQLIRNFPKHERNMTSVNVYELTDLEVFLSEIRTIIVWDNGYPFCPLFYRALRRSSHAKRIKGLNNLSISCNELLPFVLNHLFQSTSRFRRYLSSLETSLSIRDHEPYISVQVRLGKHIESLEDDASANMRFNLTAKGLTENKVASCFAKAVVRKAQEISNGSISKVFLSTDTPPYRKLVEEHLKDFNPRYVLICGHWNVTHIRYLDLGQKSEEQKVMETFADLYFLSHGQALIHSQSGFANLAKWFGVIDEVNTEEVLLDDC